MEKQKKSYRIADVVFEMSCQEKYTSKLCRDYEVSLEEAEFHIEVSAEEIASECTDNEEKFSVGYLESLAIYRKLCEKMLDYDTFLFHGSAVAVDGRAYLFTAPSGTGKSTHTRLWRKYFGKRAVMINDDKPLIQVREEAIYVCGTPWSGKHGLHTNTKAPICGIIILHRGKENLVERIPTIEAYPYLYRQTYHPMKREKEIKTLQLLKQVAERIPMFRMFCTISDEAVKTVWNAVNQQNDEGSKRENELKK